MPVVIFRGSTTRRVMRVAVGLFLLAYGIAVPTLGGLVMLMAGVFLTVSEVAGLCFTEGRIAPWVRWPRHK